MNENNNIPNILMEQTKKIAVANSETRYRGVFARENIKNGDLIERCPVIPLGFRSRYHADPQIWEYLHTGKYCECKECKQHGFAFYMILGYGLIYNHNQYPNAHIDINHENLYADVIADSDISVDQEILINFESTKIFLQKNINHAKNNQ